MARKITIPITDHNDTDICTVQYFVRYRLTGTDGWTSNVQLTQPIVITNLEDDLEYEVVITRQCCDGVESLPLEMTINTTILAAPDNLGATPNDAQVGLDWDDVTGATSYTVERAESSDYTTALTTVYTGSTSSYTDTELTNNTTYYYRVKATAVNHADSAYATINSTPTAS